VKIFAVYIMDKGLIYLEYEDLLKLETKNQQLYKKWTRVINGSQEKKCKGHRIWDYMFKFTLIKKCY